MERTGYSHIEFGERTNHSENEQIYHPNFVWYVERSSSRDINLMSYHLTSFELINQLLYINFRNLERKIFLKDLKSTLRSPVASVFIFHNFGHSEFIYHLDYYVVISSFVMDKMTSIFSYCPESLLDFFKVSILQRTTYGS